MADPSDGARSLLAEALRAEHADDHDRALDLYALAAARAVTDPTIVAEALTRQAGVYRRRSEWELAVTYAQRARSIAEDAGLPAHLAEALIAEGNALMCRGSFDEAVSAYRRLERVAQNPRQRGIALQNLGSIFAQRGELDDAAAAFLESLTLFRDAGYERGQAIAANNLGRIALDMDDTEGARRWLQEALARAKAVEDAELVALARLNLAELALCVGSLGMAEGDVHVSLEHFQETGNRWRQIECWRVLGDIAHKRGDTSSARELFERALALADAIGAESERTLVRRRLDALEKTTT